MAMTAEKLKSEHEINSTSRRPPGGQRKSREERRRQERRERAQREAAARARRVGLVQICSAGVVLFCMALALIFLQSMTAARGFELTGLRAELEEEQARTGQLEMEVASLQSSERVARIAQQELGMVPPPGSESDDSTPGEVVVASTGGTAGATSDPGYVASGEPEEKTVVLQLESPDEDAPFKLPEFADIGSWFLRWLRGGTPARADVIR